MSDFLAYASRGKNTWWRYAVSLAAALPCAILLLTVAFLVLRAAHIVPVDIGGELRKPTNPPMFFAVTAVMFGTVLACLAALIALLHDKRPADIVGRWQWTMFLAGAGFWATIQIAMTIADYLLSPRGFRITAITATAPLALYALFGLGVQTFTEDFLFRGYLTQAFLLATRRPLAAALISGSLFGALHISNGVPQAANALFFGIVCSLIAIRTGGIAFPFGLHLANNYFGAVVVVSAGDVFQGIPGVIAQDTPQLVWSDVGLTAAGLLAALWLAGFVAGRARPAEAGIS